MCLVVVNMPPPGQIYDPVIIGLLITCFVLIAISLIIGFVYANALFMNIMTQVIFDGSAMHTFTSPQYHGI